jgi:hypothetical protein
MSAWDKLTGEALAMQRQVSPDFIPYKVEFKAEEYRKIILHRVEAGFGYFLRYVTSTWFNNAEEPVNGHILYTLDDPEIEFYVRRQSRQSDPIPLRCISTPADSGADNRIVWNQPNMNFDFLLSANNLGSQKYLNYFFQFGDTIEIHLTRGGANFLDTRGEPVAYCLYLVLKGYNVPEPQARIW